MDKKIIEQTTENSAEDVRLRQQVATLEKLQTVHAQETMESSTQLEQAVSELRQKDEHLAEALVDLRDIRYALDRSIIITITDTQGKITFVNDKFCEISGYSHGEMIGQNHRILNSRYHNHEFFAKMWETIASGQNWRGDIRNRTKDGSLYWVDATIVPFINEEGLPYQFLSIHHDITDRKRTEQEMLLMTERLEQNNRELQDFAYVSSHDLQEPLRKIQAFGDRLKITNKDAFNEKGKDYLERMLNAAVRAQSLIDDLLAFSRVITKAQPFALIDLAKILEGVLSDLEIRIEQTGATIDADPLPMIYADPTQMRQLFQNLLGNALKFFKEDVPPHVQIRVTQICQILQKDQEFYEIRVIDNGIGFEQKYSDRIFQMFQRLHGRNAYQGTGIGLAICRKIVDRHNGTIFVESQPEQGATFIITLPLTQKIVESYD